MTPTRQTRPFTLIEVLVAALAGAVLLAALLAALAGAWRLQEQSHRREVEALQRAQARQLLVAELAAAVPPVGLLAAAMIAVRVDAAPWRHDELEWVSASGARNPDDAGPDVLYLRYALVEAETPGAFNLVRGVRHNPLVVETEEPAEEVILEDVVSLAAWWYDGEDWVESWDSTVMENRLPEAAHLRLDFAERDGVTPPPLEIVVPMLMRSAESSGGAP